MWYDSTVSGKIPMDSSQLPTIQMAHYEMHTNLSTVATPGSSGSTSPPFTRDSSPSPSISPTPALSACPPLGRSFSATSSASTFSRQSTTSRSSSASTALRQRGYVRPQGATFAPSARNRDSVLSLGSIAHLQYYFARTGLLDGKGGHLAKEPMKKPFLTEAVLTVSPTTEVGSDVSGFGDEYADGLGGMDASQSWDESMMLPPTVSTYSHKIQYLPPPPDSETLRKELAKALREADQALRQVQDHKTQLLDQRKDTDGNQMEDEDQGQSPSQEISSGWHEIEGLHILDMVTLAIRAAKNFYTTHESPQRLYSIKSERQIREELLSVMDVLKRMASRNFAGGMKAEELRIIQDWVKGIEIFMAEEQVLESQESKDRQNLEWLEGSWIGLERKREWLFLCSFLSEGTLPEWIPLTYDSQPSTPFLQVLQNGLILVTLQNAMLKKSKRQFGEIKCFHTDTGKPYRCAENLRYWIKSAEIRWEIKLKVDVVGVVHGRTSAWLDFDNAILQWSRAAREELTKEWRAGSLYVTVPDHHSTLEGTRALG